MSNLDRFREEMDRRGICTFLVTDIDVTEWLTGFTGSSAYVVVTTDGGRFLTDSRYTIQAAEQVKDLPSFTSDSKMDRTEFLARNVAELGINKLWFDSGKVTVAMHETLTKKLSGIELIPTTDPGAPVRLIKTPDEIAKIRSACQLADACLEHVMPRIQVGVSEWDLNLDVEFYYRKHGAELAFDPIVVSGVNSARPHGRASRKLLEAGDFVTIDCGAKLDGYCSDITRTFVVGKASERHREVYNQVLKAQLASIEAVKPGAIGKDVDAVSRRVLDEKDLAKHYGHGLGHGLGRLVHDGGALNPSSETVLAEGQVWTIEPGAYIEGFGGVRIEDDVVVTKGGCEILTHFPKDLMELS